MRTKFILLSILACLANQASRGQSTSFTYQGRLTASGAAATGLYDFQFTLRDAPTGGSALAGTNTLAAVPVTNGLFTVLLDFGSAAFSGPDRWLEIAVRPGGGANFWTLLAPRQELARAPYAIQAVSAASLLGTLPDTQLSPNVPRLDANNTFTGATTFRPATGAPFSVAGNDKKVASLNADLLDGKDSSNFVLKAGDTMSGPLNLPDNGLVVGTAQLVVAGGNVGIGTTSPVAKLNVDGGNIWIGSGAGGSTRLEFDGTSNTTSLRAARNGFVETQVAFWTQRATGAFGERVRITGDGNVGIGTTSPNLAGFGSPALTVMGSASAISGIEVGAQKPDGDGQAYGDFAIVHGNTTSPEKRLAFIRGWTDGPTANARGGELDFYVKEDNAVDFNVAMTMKSGGNVGIGTIKPQAKLDVNGDALISGRLNNNIIARAYGSAFWSESGLVAVGLERVNDGNWDSPAFHTDSSPAGSYVQLDLGSGNSRIFRKLTVGLTGGTVSAVWDVQYSDDGSTWNTALGDVDASRVPHNSPNSTSGSWHWPTVGAHRYWRLYKTNGAVGGGYHTEIQFYEDPTPGLVSFPGKIGIGTAAPKANLDVAGSRIRLSASTYPGLWREEIISADPRSGNTFISQLSQNYVMNAEVNNAASFFRWYNAAGAPLDGVDLATLTPLMVIHTSGNVGIGTGIPGSKLEVAGTITCTTLLQTSDRNVKEHFATVNGRNMLERLARVPIQTWNYTNDTAKTRHIGPMAQDFHAVFCVGADDKHIATVDADGVALAAIQGLYEIVEEQKAELKTKEKRIESLEQRLAELEKLVGSLAQNLTAEVK